MFIGSERRVLTREVSFVAGFLQALLTNARVASSKESDFSVIAWYREKPFSLLKATIFC